MNVQTRKELTRALAVQRARLLRTVATTDEEMSTLDGHEIGARADAVTATSAAAVLARLEAREREELQEIEAAQARLAAGTYGTCASCGDAIALARLRALPSTRYCLRCEDRRETSGEGDVKRRDT
jgi:DnaK suppressor protein